MSSTSTSQPSTAVKHVSGLFVTFYSLALFGAMMAINTPASVTLALRLSAIDPEGKTVSYSLLAGVGTLVALIANPLFGRLSDMTRSRFGRRRPWMVLGLIGSTVGAFIVATTDEVLIMLVGWILMQLFINATIASLLAILGDRVPTSQQGMVGGIAGMMPAASLLVGTFFVQLFPTSPLLQIGIPMAGALLFVALFVVRLDDPSTALEQRRVFGIKSVLGSFVFSPRRSPDFAWLLLSLLLIEFGIAIVLTYMVFFLEDALAIAPADLASTAFIAALVGNGLAVLASVAAGALADRLGRKKPFLIGAAVLVVVAIAVIVLGRSLPTFLLGTAIIGLGSGAYYGVYLSLGAATSNDPSSTARDLGLVNVANTLPFSLAPFLAPLVLGIGGPTPNYTLLFIIGAVISALGIPAVLRIRGTR